MRLLFKFLGIILSKTTIITKLYFRNNLFAPKRVIVNVRPDADWSQIILSKATYF